MSDKNKGDKCLSKDYINKNTKLTWQCGEGHIWQTAPRIIKHGSWCPVCSILKSKKTTNHQ